MKEKHTRLYTQWLADSREIIQLSSVREDAGLFAENAGDIFRYSMMLGMMAWREGDNPATLFNQAIDDILVYRHDLISRGMNTSNLPLSTATIIAFLLDRQSDFTLASCELDFAGDLFLDCQLAKRLQGLPPEANVQKGFERLAKLKRQALAARTYETYFDLLDMGKASVEVEKLISAAEANYSARRRDAFYSGGWDIEGGDEDNDYAVDYRLAAILKYRNIVSSSVHRWRW